MTKPLISIIIPTYNRAHLLGETLDSICSQSYQNWECIVVDDGSKDHTNALLDAYMSKDMRFRYYTRPLNFPKGANSCRNYGFDKCNGEFVNWFDSDDLMLPNNLQLKVEALRPELDFVIADSLNFDEGGNKSRPFFLDYDLLITPENFIIGKIGWITNDALLRKDSIKIRFNEYLRSGQEYNFFSRYLFYTTKGKYLKENLCYRRIHKDSIQSNLVINSTNRNQNLFYNELELIKDLKEIRNINIVNRSLKRIVRFSFLLTPKFKITKYQLRVLAIIPLPNKFKIYTFYLFFCFSNLFVGRGYIFVKKINDSLDV